MNTGVGELAFWAAMGLFGLGLTFGPIGKAIGVGLEALVARVAGGARSRSQELEELQHRLDELHGVEQRVLELEERLDFTERMLASGRPSVGPEADTPPEPVESAR